MTDHARAIEAGARAMLHHRSWSSFWSSDEARELAQACIEAAIASGALVPASAGLSAQLANMHDRIDHLEGGLQLLLTAAKAGDPHKEIIWRVEEELRQIERLRQLDTAPASGDYVAVPQSDLTRVIEIARRCEWAPEIERVAVMLNAASRTGGGK